MADRVGVSEKTVYNYFPTKGSLVLDTADEAVENMARALRERRPDQSPAVAVVEAIKADMQRFDETPEELVQFVPIFLAMIENTPALHAAWLEMHGRLAKVARDELALQAGVDPRKALGQAHVAWAELRDTGREVQRVAQEAHREHHHKQRDQLRRGRPTERGSGP